MVPSVPPPVSRPLEYAPSVPAVPAEPLLLLCFIILRASFFCADSTWSLLLVAASLGNVPVLLGGDLNSNSQYSHILQTMEASGQWIDAAKVWAEASSTEPQNTCFPVHGKPSRTDVLLVNPVAAAALVE